MDLIGKIYLASSKGDNFILVATDCFTMWVEAIPLKKAEQKDVIQFIKAQIIHSFEIPQSITRDEMTYFAKDYDIKLIRFTPFYAQENG